MQVALKRTAWDYFVDILGGIAIVAALTGVILSVIFANNAGVVQTYLVGSAMLDSPMNGHVRSNSENDEISYKLRYSSALGLISSVALVGPIDIETGTGPIFFGLCGCPPSVMCGSETPACDLSTPNLLEGSFTQIQPGGISLMDPIRELRANRADYELRVFNATYPAGTGAFRSKLPSGGEP